MADSVPSAPTPLERDLEGNGGESGGKVAPVDALKAARRRFLAQERVDMADLATELGVGRATLYRWVGGRDQLLGEVMWSLAEPTLERCKADATGTGVDWVLAVYRRFGELILEAPAVLHFVQVEPECALRVMTTKASPQQARVIAWYRDLLVEAQERFGTEYRLDPETLAFTLIRVAESFLWTDLITGEEPDLSRGWEVARVLLT
jgi:AcrR family transcriptional regulator